MIFENTTKFMVETKNRLYRTNKMISQNPFTTIYNGEALMIAKDEKGQDVNQWMEIGNVTIMTKDIVIIYNHPSNITTTSPLIEPKRKFLQHPEKHKMKQLLQGIKEDMNEDQQ